MDAWMNRIKQKILDISKWDLFAAMFTSVGGLSYFRIDCYKWLTFEFYSIGTLETQARRNWAFVGGKSLGTVILVLFLPG